MVWIAAYPAVAAVAMFIVLVIMIILRWGPKLCKLRHHALPDDEEWRGKAYSQPISYT